MKNLFLVCVVSLCIVMGCYDGGSPDNPVDGKGNPVVMRSVVVKDAGNNTLGYAVDVNEDYLIVLSSLGYSYRIDWAGKLSPTFNSHNNGLVYSGTACSGIVYKQIGILSATHSYFGKQVMYASLTSKIYMPKTVDSNGTAVVSTANVNSYESGQSGYVSICMNATVNNEYVIELNETDRITVGIPDIITAPITLDFQ